VLKEGLYARAYSSSDQLTRALASYALVQPQPTAELTRGPAADEPRTTPLWS